MIEILEFLFSSFWTWLGGLCYLTVLGGALSAGLGAMFSRHTKVVYKGETQDKPPSDTLLEKRT